MKKFVCIGMLCAFSGSLFSQRSSSSTIKNTERSLCDSLLKEDVIFALNFTSIDTFNFYFFRDVVRQVFPKREMVYTFIRENNTQYAVRLIEASGEFTRFRNHFPLRLWNHQASGCVTIACSSPDERTVIRLIYEEE